MKYIVLHHARDIPHDKRSLVYEGRWFDADQFPVATPVELQETRAQAYAEPTDRVEYRADGQAAEVWEIHLTED